MVPACVILSLGFLLSLVLRDRCRALWVGARLCFAKSNKKLFCEMMLLCMGSEGYREAVLCFSMDFWVSLVPLVPLIPRCRLPRSLRFPYDLRGF
jgi:hypothetical protein